MLLDTNAISAIGEKDEAIMGILAEAEAIMLPFAAIAEFRFGLLGSTRPEPGLLSLERLAERNLAAAAQQDEDAQRTEKGGGGLGDGSCGDGEIIYPQAVIACPATRIRAIHDE